MSSSRRVRVRGHKETWLKLTSGPLAGYLVRESPSTAYRVGLAGVLAYPVARTATIQDRTSYLFRPASGGRVARYDVDLRKGDRLLEETHMNLARPPRAPSPVLFISLALHRVPDAWLRYLPAAETAAEAA